MPMFYRTVIVDDEPLARRGIRARLRRHADFAVERECGTGEEALAAIADVRPDLVFLDVQMPGTTGLEVARTISRKSQPAVIFTTAYDQYAVQAFDVHAIDYLLKPLDDARFDDALARARRFIEGGVDRSSGFDADEGRGAPQLERFWVRTRGRVVLVPVADVDWIAAEGDYARLHVRDRSYLINDSLNSLQAQLRPARFARIHRSTIVNLARVAEIRPHLTQDHIVRLSTGTELRLSRTYYRGFSALLR